MKINDDHMYHGAALTQIAEHRGCTSINVFRSRQGNSRSAFVINSDIGVYLKYASKPNPSFKEYQFQFRTENLHELSKIAKNTRHVYIGLICVKGREICCLPHEQLSALISRRRNEMGQAEDQYTVLITLPKGKNFRVYVNCPGRKRVMLGDEILIARSDFPGKLFE